MVYFSKYSLISYLITFLILLTSFHNIMSAGSVEFKFNKIKSMISDIVWCGKDKEIIIALTEDSYLYRSHDKGFTFNNINSIIKKTGEEELKNSSKEVKKVKF